MTTVEAEEAVQSDPGLLYVEVIAELDLRGESVKSIISTSIGKVLAFFVVDAIFSPVLDRFALLLMG